jgi:hypothetical protein
MKTKEKEQKIKKLPDVQSDTKRMSAAGKWLNDTHSAPFMRIVDMRAVLR